MNLQSEIKPELWEAVSQQYEQGYYTNAILAALHYLRDVIRESADLDGDGAALIGQALGGTSPRLRINKFDTESQRDEQKGFEQILRGLFQGIRNPRTHDKIDDKKEIADAIIVFVNYCITVIQKAKGPFVIEEWLSRVFDPDFVESERYAQLLAKEVPPKRYNEALIKIYQGKTSGDGNKLRLVFNALIDLVGDDKLDDLIAVVSEELRVTSDEKAIRLAIQILPPKLWPRIDEVARLRIENKLIRSIEAGKVNSATRRSTSGALGTWARDLCKYFTLKDELYRILLQKMNSDDQEQQDYVALFFWSELPFTFTSEKPISKYLRDRWIESICRAVANSWGRSIVREKLLDSFFSFPDDWRAIILERLKPLETEDAEFYQSLVNASDIPF